MTTEEEPTPEQLAQVAAAIEEEESKAVYAAPAKKSLEEILKQDQDDESLVKYKKSLLGNLESADMDPSTPNVQVTRMTLVCDTGPNNLIIDLTGDLSELRKKPLTVKEGVDYRIKINFKVNKEIVSGLRYVQLSTRKSIKVDKTEFMVGSYGPKPLQEYEFFTNLEESPSGLLARGIYNVKSKFTDDDEHVYLRWEWALAIKKDWD